MRHFLKLSIVLWILPLAANAADPQPSASAHDGGCLHHSIQDCLAWVRQNFKAAGQDTFDEQMAAIDKTDINGKPLNKNGYLSGPVTMRAGKGTIGLGISVDERRTVTKVSVELNSDPSSARTEDDYQMTGLYEAVLAVLGAGCPEASSRVAMYRFFENVIKPKLTIVSSGTDSTFGRVTNEVLRRAPEITFCGHKLGFEVLSGEDTDQISLDNHTGVFFRPSLTFQN